MCWGSSINLFRVLGLRASTRNINHHLRTLFCLEIEILIRPRKGRFWGAEQILDVIWLISVQQWPNCSLWSIAIKGCHNLPRKRRTRPSPSLVFQQQEQQLSHSPTCDHSSFTVALPKDNWTIKFPRCCVWNATASGSRQKQSRSAAWF